MDIRRQERYEDKDNKDMDMKKEKDYNYDKMSYKHDDQKYGYQNDYKKDSKTIKCINYNFDGRSSHGFNGGGPGSGMSAFAQGVLDSKIH